MGQSSIKFNISLVDKRDILAYISAKKKWRSIGDFALLAMVEYITRNPAKSRSECRCTTAPGDYNSVLKALYSLTARIERLEGKK